MVPKEQKKVERVINFMKKGLQSLSDDLEETVKGLNDFIQSLNKALKDLKEVEVTPQAHTVSTSSKKVVGTAPVQAKTAAASTLFNLLSGGAPSAPSISTSAPSLPVVPTFAAADSTNVSGPPIRPPGGSGPPKAPGVSAGPPKAPTAGPPAKSNLPPAPKLPPTPGSGPPQAPGGATVQTPSFAKRPSPPPAPASPPSISNAPPAPQAGGGLSSLRDEMLEELNRLKKIMRGE